MRPEYRPEEPDPENKKEMPDENTWVFDEYDKLRDVISKVIDPLEIYCKTYEVFQKEYDFDPDKEMEQYETMLPEDYPEVD